MADDDIREDFREGGRGLLRLKVFARAFSNAAEEWDRLRTGGAPFDGIDESTRAALEQLHSAGQDFAETMGHNLVAFNNLARFPTLTAYLESMRSLPDCLAQLRGLRSRVLDALPGGVGPGAPARVVGLFDEQLEMGDEACRTLERLRTSSLFEWENGLDWRDGVGIDFATYTSTTEPLPADGTPTFGNAHIALVPPPVDGGLRGTASIRYTDDDGLFIIGEGALVFETKWSSGSNTAIHAYNDAPGIRTIALADDAGSIQEIADARIYDASSRSRLCLLGDIVVWQNETGAYLATRIDAIECRTHGDRKDELRVSWAAIPAGMTSFSGT